MHVCSDNCDCIVSLMVFISTTFVSQMILRSIGKFVLITTTLNIAITCILYQNIRVYISSNDKSQYIIGLRAFHIFLRKLDLSVNALEVGPIIELL